MLQRPLGFRCLKPRTRWRSATRQVLANLSWLAVDEDDLPAGTVNLVALLTMRRKRAGDLSICEKALLRRPHDERTPEEKEILASLFSGLRCFRRYPEHVRRLMAGFVSFECYGAGRTVTRVGHKCMGMYFVLSGSLEEWREVQDPLAGPTLKLHATLGPGDALGEVSLLHDTDRSSTTVTTSVVEVLLLQKRDFDNVLKASIMKTWEEIREAMATFPYFEQWGEVALRETCILAKISHFKTGDTILGDGHGQANMAYFLIRGRARLIQHLLLVPKVSSTGLVKYRCLPPGSTTFPAGTQTHFMQVAIFSRGECFGIGEDMVDRRVVADGPVSALLVPRYVLQQRGHGNLWARIRRFLNSRFPSQDALLKQFLNGRDWAKYRRDLVLHLLQGRPPLADTTIHDVPLSLRTRKCAPSEK
ncbi:cGMP-dependent protein kinase-like [Frankliniella occidentalis]|uniref:cGMP-dependent protein kinase-like n=1 Tax=Frankliniella occidentalis TaxID=133901 RepID=A0A9C6XAP5_FRAOC|nr:cGMP-dependent protein kinase-like [Frankliniella occidentalis]